MAITEFYLDVELGTGLNDGTSEANAWQSWAAAVTGWTTAGSRLNVKNPSSRYVVNATASFTSATAGVTPKTIRGYDTTIGDGVAAQFEDLTLQINVSGSGYRVECIDILNADPASATNRLFYGSGLGSVTFFNCKGVRDGTNSNTTNNCFYASGGEIVNCYAEAMFSGTITTANPLIQVIDGVVAYNVVKLKNTTGDWGTPAPVSGIGCSAGSEDGGCCHRNLVYIDPAIHYGHHTVGIVMSNKGSSGSTSTSAAGSHTCTYNTVVNFAYGIEWTDMGSTTAANTCICCNNLIAGCPVSILGRNDGNAQMPPCTCAVGNAYDGMIAGAFVPVLNRRFTVDPFTDSANEDFSLNSTIGGGLVARASALTATGSTPDIGAIQS